MAAVPGGPPEAGGHHWGPQTGEAGPHGPGGRFPPHALHHLNLSEAQNDKVFAIQHEQAPELRNRAKALHKAEAELHRFAESPNYSDARAKELADAVDKAVGEL